MREFNRKYPERIKDLIKNDVEFIQTCKEREYISSVKEMLILVGEFSEKEALQEEQVHPEGDTVTDFTFEK